MGEAVKRTFVAVDRVAGGFEAALWAPSIGRVRGFGRRPSRCDARRDAQREADDRGMAWVDRSDEGGAHVAAPSVG